MASRVISTMAVFTRLDGVQLRRGPGCAGDVCDLAAGILTGNPLTVRLLRNALPTDPVLRWRPGQELQAASNRDHPPAGLRHVAQGHDPTALRYYSEPERDRSASGRPVRSWCVPTATRTVWNHGGMSTAERGSQTPGITDL